MNGLGFERREWVELIYLFTAPPPPPSLRKKERYWIKNENENEIFVDIFHYDYE